MYKVVSKQIIASNVKRLEIEARDIASKAQCGQFVMAMVTAQSPKIALFISEANPVRGVITLVLKEKDTVTGELGAAKIGQELFSVLGPLGRPVNVASFGVVVCIGYDIGIAQILPVCRALKKHDNKVIGIIGAETRKYLFMESQMRLNCHQLMVVTDDGSYMRRGSVVTVLKEVLQKENADAVFAMGPAQVLKFIADVTKEKRVKTIVGLQTPMKDGIGLCGCCRVKVSGEMALACVDGPCFDAQAVDFDDLMQRNK